MVDILYINNIDIKRLVFGIKKYIQIILKIN